MQRRRQYVSSVSLKTFVVKSNEVPEMMCQNFFDLLSLQVRHTGNMGLIYLLYTFVCMLVYSHQCRVQMHIFMVVCLGRSW